MIKSTQNEFNTLDCLNFEDRVNELLDLRLDPVDDKEIDQHCQSCAECESVLAGYSIFVKLNSSSRSEPELLSRKDSAVRTKKQHAITAIVAAAMLVGFMLLVESSQPAPGRTAAVSLGQVNQGDSAGNVGANVESKPAPADFVSLGQASQLNTKMPGSIEVGRALASTDLSNMAWSGIGINFESLQPVLGYSRRIPVVGSVQSTVDLTLGLIRAKQEEPVDPALQRRVTPDYGYLLNRIDHMA